MPESLAKAFNGESDQMGKLIHIYWERSVAP